MDIREIREKRSDLNSELLKLISKFEVETSIPIKEIELKRVEYADGVSVIVDLNAKFEIT